MKKKNLLMTAIAIFGLATITFAQTVPSYVPTTGLVGWWPFNGNANDASTNNNNGNVNGATLTVDRFSNINSAYSFNGTTDYIQCINAGVTGFSSRSVSFWIKSNSISPGSVFSYGNNDVASQDFRCILNGVCSNDIASTITGTGKGITYNANNNWDFFTIVYDASFSNNITAINLYKNGILISTYCNNSGNGIINTSSTNPITFGCYHWLAYSGNRQFFNGSIDDIGFWNRALTVQEVTDLYNGCTGTAVTTQPINQSVNISNNAQFTTASSDLFATYQWQTDLGVGFQNLNNVGQYSGTINDTLTIANTTLSNNNQPFRCIISSGSCTDTSAVAVLTVLCNISVTTQPINQSVNISNNAQFTTASSDPLATYQWQTDLGVGYLNLNSVGQYSGTINDTLTITNTTLSNNNQPFRCIISSGSCTDTSNVAVLTVINNVGINEFTQDNLFSVYPNPANSQINVKVDSKLLESVYNVYNNTGKLVLTGKINSENTVIELGNLSGGIYLFSVGENLKQTFKVIKE